MAVNFTQKLPVKEINKEKKNTSPDLELKRNEKQNYLLLLFHCLYAMFSNITLQSKQLIISHLYHFSETKLKFIRQNHKHTNPTKKKEQKSNDRKTLTLKIMLCIEFECAFMLHLHDDDNNRARINVIA